MEKDYEITIDKVSFFKDGMHIYWSANVGFGVFSVWQEGDTLYASTEYMSDEFVNQLFEVFKKSLIRKD